MKLIGALVTFTLSILVSSQQTYLGTNGRYDEGLFAPFEDLNALSEQTFTDLKHPLFPDYNVRIKKSTEFCDGTVNAYTGWIDIAAKHLFFYFFESRGDPSSDDVIFWTNGGPGGSSALGLFMELGPCLVTHANATAFNPHSWNEKANIFFVDQPVGVGYSYAEYGEYVDNTNDAAKDIAAFTAIFFEHFSKFKGRGYHMAGESYGGRYVPVFATAVYEQNVKLIEAGLTPINLKSIMIGNGCTNDLSMMSSYYDMQCTNKGVPPITDISTCVHMRNVLPRCEKRVKKYCYDTVDPIDCSAAYNYCMELVMNPVMASGVNFYDLTGPCEGVFEETLCYPVVKNITAYLNDPQVRKIMGTDSFPGNYSVASLKVGMDFVSTLDTVFPTDLYLEGLLERGIKVLLYVGATDWICNWVGNERMSLDLEWTGRDEFVKTPLTEWKSNGAVAGKVRSAGPLTFATIYGAGHMVPHDKPEVALDLVGKWLKGESLL